MRPHLAFPVGDQDLHSNPHAHAKSPLETESSPQPQNSVPFFVMVDLGLKFLRIKINYAVNLVLRCRKLCFLKKVEFTVSMGTVIIKYLMAL